MIGIIPRNVIRNSWKSWIGVEAIKQVDVE
jgi:hypothetical protein